MGFGDEGRGGKGLFSPHPIKGSHYQCDLSPLRVPSIAWLRECLLGVSTAELLFLPLFPTVLGGKHAKEGGVRPASLRAEHLCLYYLEFFHIYPFSPICLSVLFPVYVSMDSWIIYFLLWAVIQYCFILLFQLFPLSHPSGAFVVGSMSCWHSPINVGFFVLVLFFLNTSFLLALPAISFSRLIWY